MSIAMIPPGSNPHYYSVQTEEKKPSYPDFQPVSSHAKRAGSHLPGSVLATALVGGIGVSALLVGKNAQKSVVMAKLKDLSAQALKLFQGNTAKANMSQTGAMAGAVIGAGAVATKAMQSPATHIIHLPSSAHISETVSSLSAKAGSAYAEVWNTAVKPSLKWSTETAKGHFKNSYDNAGNSVSSLVSLLTGAPQKGTEEFGKNVGNKVFETLFPKPPAPAPATSVKVK